LRRQAEYQKRLAQCSGELTARVTCVAHYVFFYYHGVHAMHWSSWLQAAFAIHCKVNGWHAGSRQGCFFASCVSMVSMAQGHAVGPFLGGALALAAPFLMPTHSVPQNSDTSVNILNAAQLRGLCSSGQVASADTAVYVPDTDVGHEDAGAEVSLAEVFAEVGICEADVVSLIASGSIAEDSLEIGVRVNPDRDISSLGALGRGAEQNWGLFSFRRVARRDGGGWKSWFY
jgi:hypothetical protein